MSWKQLKRLLLWAFLAWVGLCMLFKDEWVGDWWMSDKMVAFLAGFAWAAFCLTLGQYMDKPKTNR